MKLIIHGRNLEITKALREYTESKLQRAIQSFSEFIVEADVHLSVAKNPRVSQQTAEVTVFAHGAVIRAQERSENLYASIDLVSNKLSRQLRKYKERNSNHHANKKETIQDITDHSHTNIEVALNTNKEANLPEPSVRNKYFKLEPISTEEARHQLDLIDHDFYLYIDKRDNKTKVIYIRNHGGYGVIQSKPD